MAVSVTTIDRTAREPVTDRPLIRPPDPAIKNRSLQYAPRAGEQSHGPVRRLLHFAFRDVVTVLDVTYGNGGCWRRPLPPGIVLTTNNIDPSARTDLHLNYLGTGLPNGFCHVCLFDPPHTSDNGQTGYFWRQYRGGSKGNQALIDDVVDGALEAWRISSVGIIVKVADSNHGSEFVMLSYEVIAALGVRPYAQITTYKPSGITNTRRKVERVPDSNGAIYLAFRKDSHRHKDFDALYERQQASRIASVEDVQRCSICDSLLTDRRRDTRTCSVRCRQQKKRRRPRG